MSKINRTGGKFMLTRNGISYNLEQSPYKVVKTYSNTEIVYKFSSQLYVNKFTTRIDNNRKKVNDFISKKYKIDFSNDILSDLNLYSETEKRGFFIYIDGSGCKCLSNIKLDGQNKITMS